MEKEKTIPMTTLITTSTEAEIDYMCEYVKQFSSDVQVLSTRQIASNAFEALVYLSDVTDLYLIGLAIGRKFPNVKISYP